MSQLISAKVRSKLLALRGSLRRRLAAEAMGWLVLALVALVVVSLAFDYTLRLDRLQRAIIMAVCLGGVGVVVWKHLVRPLAAPMDLDNLALLVERRFQPLGDRLISALQLERRLDEEQHSRAMILRLADEANQLAGVLELQPIVERRRLRRVALSALLAAVLLSGFWAWQQDVMALWMARNVAFADTPWPQRTYLNVVGGPDFFVLRGDDLEVVIDASTSRTVPTYLNVYARFPSVGWTEDRVDLTGDGHGRFVKKFPAVRESFEFYVAGGDDQRDKKRPHQVRLQDPPALADVQFAVEYPKYMRRPGRPFDASGGALSAPAGSTITVTGLCTKDLRSARILLDGQEIAPLKIGTVELAAGQAVPRAVSGTFAVSLPKPSTGPATAPVRRDPARTLRLALEDTDGYTNRHSGQYILQILPDQPPTVALRKHGVGAIITPSAMIPLSIEAKDDCGLAVLRVQQTPAGRKAAPAPQELRDMGADPANVRLEHMLDLLPVTKEGQAPDPGLLAQPGSNLQVTLQADDTLPPAWAGPNRTTSTALEFKIVRPEELMAELVRRQKEVRLDFEQTIAQQSSAQARTTSAAQAAAAGVSPECVRLLTESANLQTAVSAQCVKVAASLETVLDELTNNRLGQPADRIQLAEKIIKPLRATATPMAQAVAALNGASRLADAATVRDQSVKIAAIQGDFLAKLREVLDLMAKLESRQEMAYKLEVILKTWDEILKSTQEKSDEQVKKVFETTTRPATQPASRPATGPGR